jgi:poly(A) polymerase
MEDGHALAEMIPAPVEEISRRLADAGGEVFVVGGWLRDIIRRAPGRDIDLATDLAPEEVESAVGDVGTVYVTGKKFGTVGLKTGDYTVEITTYRSESYERGSRHPHVTLHRDIGKDLARRDFTVNAIALSVAPEPGKLLDPFGGISDIERGLIRTPGLARERMAEDPLRMMRAARFSARLGYSIDQRLMDAIREGAPLLRDISWERRRDELERTLTAKEAARGLRVMVSSGMMEYVSPEVAAMESVEQPLAYHRADVLEHTLLTVMYLPPEPLLRRAALFHDVGKPAVKVTEPRVMFPGHEKISAELTREAMTRLRYGKGDIDRTVFLVRRHMRPIRYVPEWSDAAVRRLIRDCTMVRNDDVVVPVEEVMKLAEADIRAGNIEKSHRFLASMEELAGRMERVEREHPAAGASPPLDGNQLMEMFDMGPGPWIGEVKRYLEDLLVSGELSPEDVEGARERSRRFMRDYNSS